MAIHNSFALNPWAAALIGGAASLVGAPCFANPVGGSFDPSQISLATPDSQSLVVTQTGSAAVINWQDFSIGLGERVHFEQPSASAAVLNRVTGSLASDIQGQLSGTGRVLLINPNGILFGAGSRVDVAGLVASTLDISDDDFAQGNYVFAGDPQSSAGILQAGEIVASDGGFVLLAAAQVENSGLIQARLGSVVLASGSALTLQLGDGLISYSLDQASSAELAGVNNASGGRIEANGGRIWLNAHTAQALLSTVVNNQGQLTAQSMAESHGEIYLLADGGGLDNTGSLVVSADDSGSTGGLLTVAGERVNLRGSLELGTGGQLRLVTDTLRVGTGSDCQDTICEQQIESQLQQGADIELIALDQLSIAALDGGVLVGTAGPQATVSGGSLALHASGEGSAIRFEQLDDRIELDGSFLASTAEAYGGNIVLGDISSGASIGIEADFNGRIEAGTLTVHNRSGAAQLNVYAGDGVNLTAVDVEGHIAQVDSEGFERIAGAQVLIGSSNGDIVVTGAVQVSGTIDSATVGDSTQVYGAHVLLASDFASVSLQGDVDVDGTVGQVEGFDALTVSGAAVQLGSDSGATRIDGRLTVDGEVAEVSAAGNFAVVEGASLRLSSRLNAAQLGSSSEITGSVDQVHSGDFASLSGVVLDVSSQFGHVEVRGPLNVDGHLGSVVTGQGSELAGAKASFEAVSSFGERLSLAGNTEAAEAPTVGSVHFAGNASFTGTIDDAETGESGGVFGVFLLSQATNDNRLDGALTLDGRIGHAVTGDSAYLFGTFGTLLSDQGDIGLGSANVDGAILSSESGNFAQLTGAALWLDTSGANLDVEGPLDVDGRILGAQSGLGLNANGSYLYLSSLFGHTRLGGAVSVLGTLQGVQADSGQVVGSQLLTGTGFSEGYGTDLVFQGNVLQRGTLTGVNFTDSETGSAYSGSVLLDAGSYSLSFADIQADNLFAYFDSDSQIGSSRLDIAGYAELFSASVLPTLSGDSLDIHAGQLFLSVNTDLDVLTATTSGELTVFYSELAAGALGLSAGGTLQLTLSDLDADAVFLDGASVYSDAESLISAGALDVVADHTILLQGAVQVGDGSALDAGDAELLRRLGQVAPALLPAASRPNASFSAPTVGLADLSLEGDYLHIRSDFLFLGSLDFARGGLVHLEPRLNLPLFAESVDASVLGEQASKIPLNRGRIQPNIGSLSSVLGELPQVGIDSERAGSQLNFVVGEQLPSLSELILGSGLRDSTLVIGGSAYRASIQISDQLDVDVRPSSTHFVLATQAGILGSERVLTNGQVVIIDGTVFSDREAFYRQAADEIDSFYQNLDRDPSSKDDDDDDANTEKDDSQEQSCEAAT